VRAHQSRISWFGEEALNAGAEIGGDGVKMGQLDTKLAKICNRFGIPGNDFDNGRG
jgi:hypothetical protein